MGQPAHRDLDDHRRVRADGAFITTDKADVSSGALADKARAARVQRMVYSYFWPQTVPTIEKHSAMGTASARSSPA
jgi:hypothetical protein